MIARSWHLVIVVEFDKGCMRHSVSMILLTSIPLDTWCYTSRMKGFESIMVFLATIGRSMVRKSYGKPLQLIHQQVGSLPNWVYSIHSPRHLSNKISQQQTPFITMYSCYFQSWVHSLQISSKLGTLIPIFSQIGPNDPKFLPNML